MSSKYINNLTPPVGTSFFKYQDIQVMKQQSLSAVGVEYANITWNVQVYVYVTGADPNDPEFTSKGGMIYIIIVHDGTVVVNTSNVKGWNQCQLSVVPNYTTPTAQIPNNGKQDPNHEEDWTYEIEFKQSFSMFNNGGNAAFAFDAEYQQDWTRENIQQKGWLENQAARMDLFRTPDDADVSGPQQIAGLSVYRINAVPTSNVTFGCVATLRGDSSVVANQASGSFVLSVNTTA